ncbi:sigma-70 family RNA polymerase sigma factor [Anaerosporobacter sp.]|uniref:sigma-70 family RNA polymerase sigma factor n=1 Tax=Anaerosporobacter sp. TaxID=1872529 RepID=UPI00286ED885|nr:sigma-70 family RNA polymerase sigma factor [Anaerosporobacter sp.]
MDEEFFSTHIKLINELHSSISLEIVLVKMQPLIKKYTKKLYFMEKEDATQELNLALIEAIYHLTSYDNDAMCLTYLQKSVINKYNYLCKANIKRSSLLNEFTEVPDTISDIINYSDVEFFTDINELLKDKNDKEKMIAKYILLHHFGDAEIALRMGLSRQYVNRVKKNIFKEFYHDIKTDKYANKKIINI